MLTQEQVTAFHLDGFVLGNRVLSEDDVAGLMEELMRVIEEEGEGPRRPTVFRSMTPAANTC